MQRRTSAGVTHEGSGTNVLDDPRVALTWIVNELGAHGTTLGEGQFVSTGTCFAPMPTRAGDIVTGEHEQLGTLKVRIEA